MAAAVAPTTTTVRGQAGERRKQNDAIAIQAMDLAKTSVDVALQYIKTYLPWQFMHHFQWFE
jgi:hypothetical protein